MSRFLQAQVRGLLTSWSRAGGSLVFDYLNGDSYMSSLLEEAQLRSVFLQSCPRISCNQ